MHGKSLKKNGAKLTYVLPGTSFNIDAKLNGAYIVMGLLYGEGDPDQNAGNIDPLRSGFRL